MKIKRTTVLIDKGVHAEQVMFDRIIENVESAIAKVVWPPNNRRFAINPVAKGNGVTPIKDLCMLHLEQNDWKLEHRLSVSSESRAGPLDATLHLQDGRYFAAEWETGNISSSHRALNKMALGMLTGVLAGGILILPSRDFYTFLTDRIGNYRELEPYFPVWRALNITDGFLAVVEIEHDSVDSDVPLIPKGTDGWSQFS